MVVEGGITAAKLAKLVCCWAQRILERDYQVDENLIKDYFPFETVTEGTLVPSHHHHSLQA